VLYKPFITLLGISLCSLEPAAAQTPAPRIVLAQEQVAPIATILGTVSTPVPPTSLLLYQDLLKPPVHFSYLFAGATELDPGPQLLPSMKKVKTLFYTQTSLPLVQLWSGRLQVDAFQNTVHIQNVLLGPLACGGAQGLRFPRQGYPGGPPSLHFSGLSLTFYFGRNARREHPIQAWRRLSQVFGNVMN
jgi:hypothetical protein